MKLRELTITHLPGFSERLHVDGFDTGFTLVTGPNASGKSSLVRALRHLVAQDAVPRNGALTLEARFQAGDDTLVVTRSGQQVVWQRNGQSTDAPELPPGDFLRCYWLSMGDLLQAGSTETAILEQLQRELAGGFDLTMVRQDPLFEIKARQGRSESSTLQRKEKALAECRREYAALERERDRLTELDERIEAARTARTEVTRTQQALEWLAARQRRRELESELATFPEAMERLHGNERERLDELEGYRDRLAEQLRDNRRQQDEAREEKRAAGLGDPVPEASELASARQHLEEMDRKAAERASIQERLDEAGARESRAVAALQPPEGRAPEPTPEAVNQAGELAEQLRAVRLRLQELEARQDHANTEAEDPEPLRRRINELRRWLRQLEPARRRGLFAGSAVALVAAALAAMAGLFYGLPLAWAPAMVALVAAGWSAQQCVSLVTSAREARRRAEEEGVTLENWQPEPVSDRLRELETALARADYQQESARQARRLSEEIEKLQEEHSQLEGNKQALAEAVGFEPTLIGESAARFLALAAELDQARTERARLEQRLARLDEQVEAERAPVRTLLERYGLLPDDTTTAGLRAGFEDLGRRADTVTSADQALARLQARREEVEADHREQVDAIAALYRKLDLPDGERSRLDALCEQLPRHQELCAALKTEARAEQQQAAGIETIDELVALVEADDRAGLEARLSRFQQQAEAYDQWVEERSRLATRLDEAGRDRALETARFERDRAREALADAYDTTMMAEAGRFLLADVEQAHRTEREPAVLADARERFARFTHHRYELGMDEQGRFRVRDRDREREQALDELSTGTHMQLLMAVRLAWVRELEQGCEPLPLFLDEVLTTSDPERFRAIAASLRTLVRDEGRQVIYLSAEPADRVRWEEALGWSVTHRDLQALRSGTATPEPDRYELDPPATVPAPEGLAPEDWAARLQVPAIRPRQGAGAIHLFHLLRDDLPLAHHLLQDWRVDTVGRLENLLARPAGAGAVPEAEQRRELLARGRVARAWVAAWQQGRGQPVDRNALEASGAVSDNFIEPVAALAEQLEGDPRALVDALREGQVARFRGDKTDQLEEWLDREGYLDAREPLDAEARERAVLLEAGQEAGAAAIRQWVAWLEAGLA